MFASVLEVGRSIECDNDDLSTLEHFGSSAIVEAELDSRMIDVSKLENPKLLLSSNGGSTIRHNPTESDSGRRFLKRSDTGRIIVAGYVYSTHGNIAISLSPSELRREFKMKITHLASS